jgi:hypothetical protein
VTPKGYNVAQISAGIAREISAGISRSANASFLASGSHSIIAVKDFQGIWCVSPWSPRALTSALDFGLFPNYFLMLSHAI